MHSLSSLRQHLKGYEELRGGKVRVIRQFLNDLHNASLLASLEWEGGGHTPGHGVRKALRRIFNIKKREPEPMVVTKLPATKNQLDIIRNQRRGAGLGIRAGPHLQNQHVTFHDPELEHQ